MAPTKRKEPMTHVVDILTAEIQNSIPNLATIPDAGT